MTDIRKLIVLASLAFVLFSCSKDDEGILVPNETETQLKERLIDLFGSLDALSMPRSSDYEAIPSDQNNPLTADKVLLGKFLFHETGLALNPKEAIGEGTYSCASCHHAAAGFQSGIKQGIGEGGWGFGLNGESRIANPDYNLDSLDIQPIRTPTVLNTAYQNLMLWNGQFGALGMNVGTEASWTPDTPKETNNLGFEGVETQAIAGLGVHRLQLDISIVNNGPYKDLFDSAFPDVVEEERYSIVNAGLAIAAFERTVMASESPFQKLLRNEIHELTEDELKGALLFYGKANCYECHSGPGLNGMEFHALGMNDLIEGNVIGSVDEATSKGRGGFTGDPDDDYTFKTPTLYNLKDVSFLGHGGSFNSVFEVIEYKNAADAENPNIPDERLSSLFIPLGLSTEEIEQLSLFIENGLYDDNLSRYVPDATPLGSCFPNADQQSKSDLGCD
ncbi:MAG: cytochrome c peroxidase [Flavobacteriaceae bacterium]